MCDCVSSNSNCLWPVSRRFLQRLRSDQFGRSHKYYRNLQISLRKYNIPELYYRNWIPSNKLIYTNRRNRNVSNKLIYINRRNRNVSNKLIYINRRITGISKKIFCYKFSLSVGRLHYTGNVLKIGNFIFNLRTSNLN